MKTCAHCGHRDATEEDHIEGRPVPSCKTCLGDVADPAGSPTRTRVPAAPIERERILAAIRAHEPATPRQIADAVGVGTRTSDPSGWNRFDRAIRKAVREGVVEAEAVTAREFLYRIARVP